MRDWRRYVPSIVRHLRADLKRRDPHWPAQLAALVAVLLYLQALQKTGSDGLSGQITGKTPVF